MLTAIFGALLTTGAALALGRLATRRVDVPIAISFGAGAAIVYLIVFALMLAGQAFKPALAVLGATSSLLLLPRYRPRIRIHPPRWWIAAIMLPFALLYLVNALAPEIQADANTYHLIPAIEASRTGGFPAAITFYDRLPHATELLFVHGYAFGGAPAAKLIHLGFLFWTLPLILAIGRKLDLPDPIPATAAALYFITPVAGVSATSAFNDAALIFYVLAAVLALISLRETPSPALALLAGVLAGMCYTVKMNGAITILAVGLFLVIARQWRALPPFVIGVGVTVLPWILRNSIGTGNPFAPFFNAFFPNEYFYVGPEQQLSRSLRSYGVPFLQRFWEVTAGWRLQGVIGPVFLAAPLALLAVRRRGIAVLLFLAIVFSAGWWLNAGTRFLLPAIPFLALAIVAAFPQRVGPVLLTAHAFLSLPWIIERYSPRVWRLADAPWRAAAGLESPEAYLTRVSGDYRLARMVEQNTPPNARIFDLLGLHKAHVDRRILGHWQSAEGHRLLAVLETARTGGPDLLYELHSTFAPQLVAAVRIRQEAQSSRNFSVNNLALSHSGERLPNSREWKLSASRNPWDLPLAFDGSRTSRWSTWHPSDPRDYVVVEFGRFETLDTISLTTPAFESDSKPIIEIISPGGTWKTVPAVIRRAPPVRLRLDATRHLARSGVTHIVTPVGFEGVGVLGKTLANDADDWGLEVVANMHTIYVLKIR